MLSYHTFTVGKDIGFVNKILCIGAMLVMSCESQVAIRKLKVSMVVVAVVAMYGERWLAWLPKVCNYQLPV